MFSKYIGELIKYQGKYWLVESVNLGVAELWRDGKFKLVPIDDLNIEDIVGHQKK